MSRDTQPLVFKIPVTTQALVDEQDYWRLRKFKWTLGRGYAYRSRKISGEWKTISMSHDIMGYRPGYEIDHINHNTLDNRRCNLRWATRAQQIMNARMQTKQRYRGIRQRRPNGKFSAVIAYDGKYHYLGSFKTAEEAARAYDKAAKELHGEFATLNFK